MSGEYEYDFIVSSDYRRLHLVAIICFLEHRGSESVRKANQLISAQTLYCMRMDFTCVTCELFHSLT